MPIKTFGGLIKEKVFAFVLFKLTLHAMIKELTEMISKKASGNSNSLMKDSNNK
jgi:hypothetical protein